MKTAAALMLGMCLLSAGCDRGGRQAGPLGAPPAQPIPGLPGPLGNDGAQERTWAGLLPCSDCDGVDTRLVLRSQGGRRAYLLSERYVGGSGRTDFNRAGTWTEETQVIDGEARITYVLDPEHGGQRFSVQPDGALQLMDGGGRAPGDAIAYRLQRL